MKDRIVTYTFGIRYIPMLWVFLYSIEKNVPNANPLICYDRIPASELELIKQRYTNAEYRHFPIERTKTQDKTPVSIKSWFLSKFMPETDLDVIYMMDTDTLVVEDPREYWDNKADFIVTHRPTVAPINAGVIFLKNNERTRKFVKLWSQEVEEIASDEPELMRIKHKYGGAGQGGFIKLMLNKNPFEGTNLFYPTDDLPLVVKGVPCKELNQTDGRDIKHSKVLHLKGLSSQYLLGELQNFSGRNWDAIKKWKEYYKKAELDKSEAKLNHEG